MLICRSWLVLLPWKSLADLKFRSTLEERSVEFFVLISLIFWGCLRSIVYLRTMISVGNVKSDGANSHMLVDYPCHLM